MAETGESIEILVEMGFSRDQAERALAATKDLGSTVEAAINWLELHGSTEAPTEATEKAKTPVEDAPAASTSSVTSITFKCDECGKLLRSQDDAVLHAEKTKHEKFSESTEELKQLPEEERKAQVARLEERFNEIRKKKEAEEERANIDSEMSRRLAGRNLQDLKRKFDEEELRLHAEAARREKEADQLAKAKILAQIEADKRNRAVQAGKLPADGGAASSNIVQSNPEKPAASTAPRPTSDSTRLQVRLPTGDTLQHVFASKEQLAAVRLFVQVQRKDMANFSSQYSFMTTFPKKVFTDAEMEMPLDALGLVPSASLIICRK